MLEERMTVQRLHQGLVRISRTVPRLIATPPVTTPSQASRRASVAIIIRLRPGNPNVASNPASSIASPANTSPTTPSAPSDIQPSPPRSPRLDPAPSTSTAPPATAADAPASHTAASSSNENDLERQLKEFFDQAWVKDPNTRPEVLFIKRASRQSDKWSGHVAFPGGRQEPDDEDGRFTAMRESWEEVGLDLAEKEWLAVGQLDDREITTSLGKRLLMVLSPYVFLHTSPRTPMPELQETEVASAHWIDFAELHPPKARYGHVSIDLGTRLAPRNAFMRSTLRFLLGSMHFKCILLPYNPIAIGQETAPLPDGTYPELKLWGLTLGMTLDMLSHMSHVSSDVPTNASTYPDAIRALTPSSNHPLTLGGGDNKNRNIILPALAPPSTASIFPQFVYPDINFLIWVFGFRYRRIARTTDDYYSRSRPADSRVNWAGMSLGHYYAAVRRALIFAVLFRASIAGFAVVWIVKLVRNRWLASANTMKGAIKKQV